MANLSAQQTARFALVLSVILGGISCGSGQEKKAISGTKDGVAEGVKVVAASASASALQKQLHELAPVSTAAPGTVHKRIGVAVDSFLQRIHTSRLHVTLDKPIYQPGETIWFRTWELGTPDMKPATQTGQAMNFVLISPKGAAVMTKRVRIKTGVARNDFALPHGVPGGEYKIVVTSDTGSRVERSVIVSSYEPPQIKKKLEFTRKSYGPGDVVSVALALHRATGEPMAAAKVTAIVGVDGFETARKTLTTSANGSTLIKFALPSHIVRGDGLLTVLVQDGGITESIQKRIPIVLKRLKLSLFAEGGNLVQGLPGRVYFAAKTLLNKPADVAGRVVDDKGATIAEFGSLHAGMGRFEIIPASGRTYRVHITRPAGISQTFALPRPVKSGCAMLAVDDFKSQRDDVRIAVWCDKERTVIATATLRERRIATQSATIKPGAPAVFALPSSRTDQGTVRVTLFSNTGAPLAERLVYRGRGVDMKVSIKADRNSYSPRDRVTLAITTTGPNGKPVAADLAVAVVNDTVLSFANDKNAHLLAKMYLEHEMPGQKIHEPNFYFSNHAKAAPALDLVLGTLGWRRFSWHQVLSPGNGSMPSDDRWDAVRGYHTSNARHKSSPTRTAVRQRRRRTLRVLHRMAGTTAAPPALVTTIFAQPAAAGTLTGVVTDHKRKPLGGVAVVARSTVTQRRWSKTTNASGRYTIGSLPPGRYSIMFHYQGARQNRTVSIRLGRSTLLNGRLDMRFVGKTAHRNEQPAVKLNAAAPRRRPRRRRALAAKRPADMGGAGVRARRRPPRRRAPRLMDQGNKRQRFNRKEITVDKDWKPKRDQNAKKGPRLVWAVRREFPAPNYDPGYKGPRSDFRETIHWAPMVRTGKDGKATVSFSLSDSVTSFRTTVQGVSVSGRLGRAEALLKSKRPISLVAKLPLEVSAGDKIRLPVTLTNETERRLTANLRAVFGAAFKTVGNLPKQITLNSGERKSLFYTLQVVGNGRHKADGRVVLSVETANLKDEITRVIDVMPLGFPQQLDLAGTVNTVARHKVDLSAALPGTITTSLTMYPSPLATMTKGSEGILREPHGCFEQASSANYPNVMVMNYLENHNAANPELISKTQGMLDRGYRKLIGYESPKRGYEWFGGDPGHEALTAYGLMEFVDMAKVHKDTDMVMVRRTAAWLKSRRDGKGGYKQNKRALDSFGRASVEVTNGYITWALANAGETDLAAELDYQRRMAAKTKDPYVMALATGTMVKLDPKGKATNAALRRLAAMRKPSGVYSGANHSITRSGGIALNIEATALAVLTLLDSGTDYVGHVRSSIAWIDKQRNGSGAYASTQSTIMALKAMTAYAAATRMTRASGTAELVINGRSVQRLEFKAGHKEALVFADAATHMKRGTNIVEVRLTSTQSLPYSMAINYRSKQPTSSSRAAVRLDTRLAKTAVPWGESVKLHVKVSNATNHGVPMALARVGLPGGLTFQTWQLKELKAKKLIDFYETRDREVILYFRSLAPNEVKAIDLQLMATVPGTYVAPASAAYLYYTDEHKHWVAPVVVSVVKK